MIGLLPLFLYSLPPVSSFLGLIAMSALRRRMQVLGRIWHELPLPPPLVIGFLYYLVLSVSEPFSPPLLSELLSSLVLADLDRHRIAGVSRETHGRPTELEFVLSVVQ
jgi:hypothetical protein